MLAGSQIVLGPGFTAAATNTSTSLTASIGYSSAPTITTGSPLPQGTVGVSYSLTFSASGGSPPYSFTLQSGSSLPPSLTLATGGALSGTPTGAGTSSFTVVVTDSAYNSGSKAFGLTVTPPITITTNSPLPNGTAGSAYSQTLTATGGTSPYSWSATGLPIGITLSPSGVLSGYPVVANTLTPAVNVTDSVGRYASKALSFTASPNASTIAAPSALQANLSFMSFGYYDTSHNASSYGFSQSCPSGSSVRGCFQQVLPNLRSQGVSGVRIFVGLCEDDTTISPLTNCGQTTSNVSFNGTSGPGLTWVTNAANFFQDLANAGIENVTITLADSEQLYYSSYPTRLTLPLSGTSSPNGLHCQNGSSDPVQFSPTIPFGLNYSSLFPIGQDEPASNGYNCAPINPYFVGWSNVFSAVGALLGAAQGKVNVYELEPEQEIDMVDFTAYLRYVDDELERILRGCLRPISHADEQPRLRPQARHVFGSWVQFDEPNGQLHEHLYRLLTPVYSGFGRICDRRGLRGQELRRERWHLPVSLVRRN